MHFEHVAEQQLKAYQLLKGSTEHLHGIIMVFLDPSGEEGKEYRQPTARHSADSPVSMGSTTTNGPTAAGKPALSCRPEAQSQQFPVRPRSHHPAHSCSQPFGNQTLQEGSRKKKDLISVTLFFPEGSVNRDRRQACRWTWGMFHERFHIFMSIFLSQDLAILPKA